MNKPNIIIAIDPDVDKSGVAYLSVSERVIEVKEFTFPLLLDFLQDMKKALDDLSLPFVVVVEAGHLIKGNFHVQSKFGHRKAAAIGADQGRNNEVGRKIVEMCRHYGIETVEKKPLSKHWKAKDGKISHEEITYFMPIKDKTTNPEKRDSALLAWHHAGLPIKKRA